MTRVKSQIQHDYKSLVKPEGHTPRRRSRRWFVIGLVIPVVLVALVLLLSPGGESQNAIAATAVDTPAAIITPAAVIETDTSDALPVDASSDDAGTAPRATQPQSAPSEATRAPQPSARKSIPVRDNTKLPPNTANPVRDSATATVALALPPRPTTEAEPVAASPAARTPTTDEARDQPAASVPGARQTQNAPRPDAPPTRTAAAPLEKPADTRRKQTAAAVTTPVALLAAGQQTRPLPIPQRSANTAGGAAVEATSQPGEPLTLTIASGDSLDKLFIKNDLSRGDLATLLNVAEAKEALTLLMPGDQIDLRHDGSRILALTRKLDEQRTLHIERTDQGFIPRIEQTPVEVRINRASATIDSSLFLAAKAAGISDNLAMNLAGIFAWDIDFVLDIRKGDRFSVIYEEIWQNGRHLRDGNIVAAMFMNDGDEFRALRYTDPEGNDGYFTPEGVNVKKAFLRAPIKFTPRVTSNFNPKRLHPVHKRVRPHRGVDYGAPTGTPIIAAGDGKVLFRGRKGGYGNTVILQHGGNITTLYAHMSKFNRKVKQGGRVKQGQIIGYVGATGTVTARHLHYEYRVNGVHRNPRTVSLPKARPIPSKFIDDFRRATAAVQNQLEVVSRDTRIASAD